MASTFSALKIELIGTGEQVGTWGDTTNTNLGTAIEEAIVGSVDVPFSSADVTLTLTDVNTTQPARHLRLNLTGTSGGDRNLILGSGCQIDKPYIINNGLADTVTVKNTSGTGVAVPAGKTMWVFNNGTNVVDVTTYLSSLALGSALPVTSGGTGITSFGAGVATWLGTPSSANLAAAVTDETGSGALVFGTSPTIATATLSSPLFVSARETVTVSATAASSTINYDVSTQSVLYYTSNASGNWTLNVRGSSGATLNSVMSTGQSMTFAFLVTNGATAYRQTALTIDSASVTPKWQGGTAPSSGNTNSVDIYTLTVIKTGDASFTVFEAQTKFA